MGTNAREARGKRGRKRVCIDSVSVEATRRFESQTSPSTEAGSNPTNLQHLSIILSAPLTLLHGKVDSLWRLGELLRAPETLAAKP